MYSDILWRYYFLAEVAPVTESMSGNFKMYISQWYTGSFMSNNFSTPWRFTYSPKAQKIFISEWTTNDTGDPVICVVDPFTNTIEYNYTYTNTAMFDSVYDPYFDCVYVWVSSSLGERLDKYNADGSALIDSYPVTTDWAGQTNNLSGLMAFNSRFGDIIMVPDAAAYPSPLSWSVYRPTVTGSISSGVLSYKARFPIYVPVDALSGNYYLFPFGNATNPATKIADDTFAVSSVTNMTGSGYGAAWISQSNTIWYENAEGNAAIVYDASTDLPVARVPGINDLQFAVYDKCKNCVIISDDAAGDPSYTQGGGLCFVTASDYSPVNFIGQYGVYDVLFCDATSTVYWMNYNNNQIYSTFTAIPTGSFLPQPTYPYPPPTASLFCGCIPSGSSGGGFTFGYNGTVGTLYTSPYRGGSYYADTQSFYATAGSSYNVFLGSSDFDAWLIIYDPSDNFVAEDDYTGPNDPGDIDDASLTFVAGSTGFYTIEATTYNAGVTGNYHVRVSESISWPSVDRAIDGVWNDKGVYISSSGWVLIGDENSNKLTFVDPFNHVTGSSLTIPRVVEPWDEACGDLNYSPVQDKIYAVSFYGSSNAYIHVIDANNTSSISASISTTLDSRGWLVFTAYNPDRDHLLLVATNASSNPNWVIWDCATETEVASGKIPAPGGNWVCCYVTSSKKYYTHNSQYKGEINTIDGQTYAYGTASFQGTYFGNGGMYYVPEFDWIINANDSTGGPRIYLGRDESLVGTLPFNNGNIQDAAFDTCRREVVFSVYNWGVYSFNKELVQQRDYTSFADGNGMSIGKYALQSGVYVATAGWSGNQQHVYFLP